MRVYVIGGSGFVGRELVRALGAGGRYTVWESPDIDMTAAPTLAADAGELIRRIAEDRHAGIFHCCGSDAVDRRTLAFRAVDALGLDGELLDFGPAPPPPYPGPVRHERSMACST
jgi:dTDP-4-dehydrorhamnose reductase